MPAAPFGVHPVTKFGNARLCQLGRRSRPPRALHPSWHYYFSNQQFNRVFWFRFVFGWNLEVSVIRAHLTIKGFAAISTAQDREELFLRELSSVRFALGA